MRMPVGNARRFVLTALACLLSPIVTACNDQPPASTPPSGDVRVAAVDKSVTPADTRSGAPAKPAISEAELGIPFYPGATPYQEPGTAADSSTVGKGISATLLETGDPLEKVVAFYQEQLTGPDETGKSTPPSRRESTLDGKSTVTLSRIDGRTIRAAAVRQGDKSTVIELMHMDAPANSKMNLPGTGAGTPPGQAPAAGQASTPIPASGAAGTVGGGAPPASTPPSQRGLKYP